MQRSVARARTWLNGHKLLLWLIAIWLAILVVSLWWGPAHPSLPKQFLGSD
jgi:hypothetical protein